MKRSLGHQPISPFALLAIVSLAVAAQLSARGAPEITVSKYASGVSVHDPSIIQSADGYYIFGSHMEVARTTGLRRWTTVATGVDNANPLFSNLFTDRAAFAYVGRNATGWYSVWAPDVIFNRAMQKYVMYFCTTLTYVKSNLCVATADDIARPYEFRNIILFSGFTPRDIDRTDVPEVVGTDGARKYSRGSRYENNVWPNAIDPNVFYDADGRMWMV